MSKSQKKLFALPEPDLAHILHHAATDLEQLRGKNLFITGGTGFFGKWLVGGLGHANAELGLGLQMTVLSRDPTAFQAQYPEIESVSGLTFAAGDVADFSPEECRFDYILHAATETGVPSNEAQEQKRSRTIVEGTRRMLELTRTSGARRLLNVSSGAVYGAFAGKPTGASEDDYTAAEPLNPYAVAKREAEQLCEESALDFVTARAFAFLGPHLPLDAHFAAGNFLRDAHQGTPILVRGDGTALRSYLYPADLVLWLLRILVQGQKGRAYNVGSDEKVSTAQLARLISVAVIPPLEVTIQSVQQQGIQNIYLPDIHRARTELDLDVFIPLREAIRRTLEYLKNGSK